MNIYHIRWTRGGRFSLVAVVIASDEAEAINRMALDDGYDTDIQVGLMGICTDGTSVAGCVCAESL